MNNRPEIDPSIIQDIDEIGRKHEDEMLFNDTHDVNADVRGMLGETEEGGNVDIEKIPGLRKEQHISPSELILCDEDNNPIVVFDGVERKIILFDINTPSEELAEFIEEFTNKSHLEAKIVSAGEHANEIGVIAMSRQIEPERNPNIKNLDVHASEHLYLSK